MVVVSSNLGIFGEYGGSNSKEKSEGGLWDREETKNLSKKEYRKDQPS